MAAKFFFTSESVGRGHPDKICDQISDAVLDAFLERDPHTKAGIETAAASDLIMVFGEVNSSVTVNVEEVVKKVLNEIGYNHEDFKILNKIIKQSPDISQALVDENSAGDQGIMFGYATDETPECMPATLIYAHKLVRKIEELRTEVDFLGSDCKSQVTIEYTEEDGKLRPLNVNTIVISAQHTENIENEEVIRFLKERVVDDIIPADLLKKTKYFLQPSGRFILGGPKADSGLTGRKIIVDTYGGFGNHGGGCFSGKDWSKVDRSGAYAARWISKSLVKAGICKRISIQISYAIGVSDILSINVNSYNTSKISDNDIIEIIKKNFDLRPGKIMRELGLNKPIYQKTACFGHFGNDEYPWEIVKKINFD